MMKTNRKSYKELVKLPTYKERFEYAKLDGRIGDATFGGHRYLNQVLYRSDEWHEVRRKVILRDEGCDLGHPDHPIFSKVYIHHLNPITIEDIRLRRPCIFDLDNLICVLFETHNAIHYGGNVIREAQIIERSPYDTCPWR